MTAVINPIPIQLPNETYPRGHSFIDKMDKENTATAPKASPIDEGQTVGNYLVGQQIGQGSFGIVKLGTHVATREKVALKFIDSSKLRSQKERDNVKREIRIMQLLDHPNIVELKDVVEVPGTSITCLVLEYITGGELFDYIVANRRLKEDEAARFFRQVLQGIEYCHSNLVIHRDLKPENLLLDAHKNIKINDFGLSNIMEPGRFLHTFCGSPLYSSPEIILETNYIGPEVDIWALGVILYAMVTGYLPWDGNTLKEQVHNAVRGKYEVPLHVSKDCKDLIARMLTINPKHRATFPEIRNHPWVTRGFGGPPPSCVTVQRDTANVDEQILDQMVGLGFDKNEVANDIRSEKTTKQSFVIYFLLLGKKQKAMERAKPPVSPVQTPESPKLSPEERANRRNGASRHSWDWDGDKKAPTVPPSIMKLSLAAIPEDKTAPPAPLTDRPSTTTKEKDASPRKIPFFSKLFAKKDGKDGPSTPRANPTEALVTERKRRGTVDNLDVSFIQQDDEYLKSLNGAFTADTTTMKPVPVVHQEIERVLNLLSLQWKLKKNTWTVKNETSKLGIEIELCKVNKFEGMKGLKFKRTGGDVWEYKDLYQKIISHLHL